MNDENLDLMQGISHADIEAEIKKLPKAMQDEIIHEANEVVKEMFEEDDNHGQLQKQKLHRKLSRYKNKI